MNKGIFTISIDTELAWGTFDHGGHYKYRTAYEKYRDIIKRLLVLFKKYEIAATWAVVGHLFLERCDHPDQKNHPDIVRPHYLWYPKDWFSCDPQTNMNQDPLWYGKDIIEILKDASPPQEIASHSFSHINFSDDGCSKAAAASDLKKCVELAQLEGLHLKSFVFPRNAIGHLDQLKAYGFRTYRFHPEMENIQNGKISILRRSYGLIKDILPFPPSVYDLKINKEVCLMAIPASMQFRYAQGPGKWVFPYVRYIKSSLGLTRAIKQKKLFHLWFHPINFAWKGESMFWEFEQILIFASQARQKGMLDILPMKDLEAYVEISNE